jgi:hypothetical protein
MPGMAPASWIRRLATSIATLALAVVLLAPPPGVAAPERPSDSPAHEIGAGCAGLVGVAPSTPKRGADGTFASLRVCAEVFADDPAAARLGAAPVGGEAPALARWRLAHGTSTASP